MTISSVLYTPATSSIYKLLCPYTIFRLFVPNKIILCTHNCNRMYNLVSLFPRLSDADSYSAPSASSHAYMFSEFFYFLFFRLFLRFFARAFLYFFPKRFGSFDASRLLPFGISVYIGLACLTNGIGHPISSNSVGVNPASSNVPVFSFGIQHFS